MNNNSYQPDSNGLPDGNLGGDSEAIRSRMLELLAGEFTSALAPEEAEELASLRRRVPPIALASGEPIDDGSLDMAAGALIAASVASELAASGEARAENALSPAVRARLLTAGQQIVQANANRTGTRTSQSGVAAGSSGRPAGVVGASPAPRPLVGPVGWIGWLAAAAASVALVVSLRNAPPQVPAAPSNADRLAALIADPENTVRISWQSQPDPAAKGVSGEVIWNGQLQEGFMRFTGLAANLPSKEQYQLWIFDAGRTDSEFPVDGGVFDITSAQRDPKTGDLLVPIRATLPVRRPAAFAVTIEQPGGVVVTKKERLLVLAPVKASGG